MSYTYRYPRPALTVDAVIFRKEDQRIQVLLIRRKHSPFEGMWALPGGFVEMDEDLDEAVARELEEETGLKNIALKQLHTFGAPDRDPRHRTVSVVFSGWLTDMQHAVAGDDARNINWFDIDHLPDLAFDHEKILQLALQTLSSK